jgi:CBS domain-containing protein
MPRSDDSLTRLTVEDLMATELLVVGPFDPIAKALDRLATSRVHHLPVVDERGAVVGILSDRDLLRALAGDKSRTDPVGAAMSTEVYSLHREAPADQAVRLMREHEVNSIVVLGPGGVLEGIVTSRDFLRVAEGALRA